MSALINIYNPSRCLHSSSDSRTLTIPCVRTKTCGQHSFVYQGPATWHDLPFYLRQSFSVHFQKSFKNLSFSSTDLNCNKYLCCVCMVVFVISVCALCICMIIVVIITCVFVLFMYGCCTMPFFVFLYCYTC